MASNFCMLENEHPVAQGLLPLCLPVTSFPHIIQHSTSITSRRSKGGMENLGVGLGPEASNWQNSSTRASQRAK